MIEGIEPRRCDAPGCGKPLERKPKEKLHNFRKRRFCDFTCMGKGYSAERPRAVELRPCGNPACGRLIERPSGEGPAHYNARKYCSRACAGLRGAEGRRGVISRRAGPVTASKGDEAAAVEAFLTQNSITYCPPRHVAPSEHLALYGKAADKVIARIKVIPDTGGWKAERDARFAFLHRTGGLPA